MNYLLGLTFFITSMWLTVLYNQAILQQYLYLVIISHATLKFILKVSSTELN